MIDQKSNPAFPGQEQNFDLLKSAKDKWTAVIFISIFIPLFLLTFQPFGVNNFDPTYRIRWPFLIGCILFGLMGGLTMMIYEFWLTPRLFKRSGRLILLWRMALLMVLMATSLFLLYNVLGGFHDWRVKSYFEFIGNITFMGSLPMAILLLYLQYREVRSDYEKARKYARPVLSLDQLLRLSSDQGNDHLSIKPENLLYIEAQGNYVFIYHLENEAVKKSLLRITMKKLERQLRAHGIVRCHRSFLVNTFRIAKVSGNTHQLQLHLSGLSDSIPVSRSYSSAFERSPAVHPV